MTKIKNIITTSLIGLMFLISGCTGGNTGTKTNSFDPSSAFNGGGNSLTLEFQENAPPETVRDQGLSPFSVRILVKNEGEYDIPENSAYVSLVGIDKTILNLEETSKPIPALNGVKKQGSNIIDGRQQYVLFSNLKYTESIAGATQPLNLNVDVCYPYQTKASTSLCINGDTSVAIDENLKLCDLDSDRASGSSGGPITIANVKQYATGTSRIEFQFDIIHNPLTDTSTLFKSGTIDPNCKINGESSSQAISSKNIIKYSVETGISGLNCEGTGTNGNEVTLYSNTYQVVCSQEMENQEEYEKSIGITLEYDYLNRISKTISIEHIQR